MNIRKIRMNIQPKRIHIIGSSGSGKTTLAKKLSKKLGYQHIDLDTIRYPEAFKPKRPIEERLPLVKSIAIQDNWVTEGMYIFWVDALLKKADQIIYLDVHPIKTIPRVLSRFIYEWFAGIDKYGIHSTIRLVKFIFRYHYSRRNREGSRGDGDTTRAKTYKTLEDYKEKLIILKSNKEISGFLNTFNSSKP